MPGRLQPAGARVVESALILGQIPAMSVTVEQRKASTARLQSPRAVGAPPLGNGDDLDANEFLRRYEHMPEGFKAELVDGTVYLASPVSFYHGESDGVLQGWLSYYATYAEGVRSLPNTTIRLDAKNTVQPDAVLVHGTPSTTEEGYITSVPGFVAEIALTSASLDLHRKLEAYRRRGVPEYLVWRPRDQALDWFVLDAEGSYHSTDPGADGLLRSRVFPGLVLDPQALLRLDRRGVLETLERARAQASSGEAAPTDN